MEQLLVAAERTVAAAAAAIVWTGDDGHGVLEHVAAADPQLMASTRFAYERRSPQKPVPCDVHRRLDREYSDSTEKLEVAGLPRTVASAWASRVVAAFLAHSSARPRATCRSLANEAFLLRDSAFHACRMWAEDPMRIDRILFWAQDAQACADRLWRAEKQT